MFLARAAVAIRSVGRIKAADGLGTGFLVAPGLLMTNNHVLASSDASSQALVQFRYEVDLTDAELPPVEFRLDPSQLFRTDADLDFTLVAVTPTALDGASLDDFGHLPLVGAEDKIRLGRLVNIVQHPAGARKQVIFRESILNALPESLRTKAHYTGDTKPGSSGSPVFGDAWEGVALHHSGIPDTNEAADWLDLDGKVWDEANDPEWERVKWIGNEGIRASSLVARVRDFGAEAVGPARDLLQRALAVGEEADRHGVFPPQILTLRPPRQNERTPGAASDGAALVAPSGSATVQIPLMVTVTVSAPRPEIAIAGLEDRRERDADDYADRLGFDRAFLGLRVELPMPQNTIAANVATLAGSTNTEFRYNHFSVLMNRRRRLAYVSAGNHRIDAPHNAPRRDPVELGNAVRPGVVSRERPVGLPHSANCVVR